MASTPVRIDPKQAEHILLASANEDYIGLYEAIWEFNTKFSNATLGEKYSDADHALRSLYSRSLIQFYRAKKCDKFRNRTYDPIEHVALDEVLSNPVSWYPEYGGIQVGFFATEAGERAQFTGSLET